jgi:transposase-like protein
MASTTTAAGAASALAPVASPAPALLKADACGRVRSTPERRAAILAEFERSGVSAAQFARLAGIKYSTFAQWVQRHRRRHPARKPAGRALRLLEAIVAPNAKSPVRADEPLRVHLPGGGQLAVTAPGHIPLVAALLQALAARC